MVCMHGLAQALGCLVQQQHTHLFTDPHVFSESHVLSVLLQPVGPEPPSCSAQWCGSAEGWTWLVMATPGAGPIPTLRWWRRTLSPKPPPPPMATEVRRHPGDTLASVWGHIHTADKTWLDRSQGDGASVSCPLQPTVALLRCEVLHNHYRIVRSAFPMSIHPCWNWLHGSNPASLWKEKGIKSVH